MASSSRESDERDPVRRARIVEAAIALFARYGVRRTSMELLAKESRVAKPTLYAYFESKEALFVDVCQHVMDGILADAEKAAAARGSVEERISGLLIAKYTRVFELVEASPHAAELLGSQEEHAARVVAKGDKAYRALLVRVAEEESASGRLALERAGLTAAELADLLMRSASGASAHTKSVTQHRKNVQTLVHALVAGIGSR